MTRILLIDDHQIVLDGLEAMIADQADLEVVGQAQNGQEGLKLLGILKPDLVMFDIDMPVMNGLVFAKEARRNFPAVKLIVLSLHREASMIKHLLQLGVAGYLLKTADKESMLQAIRQVSQGQRYFGAEVTLSLTEQGSFHTPLLEQTTNDAQRLSLLTPREREILIAIAEGYSNREIADRLHISPRTADTHRANLMKKLDIPKVVGLVKFAMRNGLIR